MNCATCGKGLDEGNTSGLCCAHRRPMRVFQAYGEHRRLTGLRTKQAKKAANALFDRIMGK